MGLVVRDDEKCFPLDGSNLGACTKLYDDGQLVRATKFELLISVASLSVRSLFDYESFFVDSKKLW